MPIPIKRLFNLRTPTRDGIELSSDLWLPAAPGRYPVILCRTPYLKTSQPPPATMQPVTVARYFAERGYAFAIQDCRGRGDSGGEYGYYHQEGPDGYDTIEWIARQPWCNGQVGMMGVSYSGACQWLAAREKPPHLKCITPIASPGDYFNEIPYVGGAFQLTRLWWANLVSGRIFQTNVAEDEWPEIVKHRPLITADEVMGRKMPLYREWLEHSTLDEYWKRVRLTETDYCNITLPALHITGWFDVNQAGALYHWQGMMQSSSAKADQFLMVGPWEHGQTWFGGALKVGAMDLTQDSIQDLLPLHLAFFDRYLKETASRFQHPRARLYLTGANDWRDFSAYPVPGSVTRKLHLMSGGNANTLAGDGRLLDSIAREAAPDRYEYDPQDPVPINIFTPGAAFGADRRLIEERQDVLVYTGEPLRSELKVVGRVGVELFAASDAPDTDFTAAIVDVYPDGRAVLLGPRAVGIIRARFRNSLEKEEFLTPGRIETYHIDLGHIAHVFLPGHRVRIEISSSAAPLYHPNPNTGNPIARDVEWRKARQTIHHDASHPSAVILPVLAD